MELNVRTPYGLKIPRKSLQEHVTLKMEVPAARPRRKLYVLDAEGHCRRQTRLVSPVPPLHCASRLSAVPQRSWCLADPASIHVVPGGPTPIQRGATPHVWPGEKLKPRLPSGATVGSSPPGWLGAKGWPPSCCPLGFSLGSPAGTTRPVP